MSKFTMKYVLMFVFMSIIDIAVLFSKKYFEYEFNSLGIILTSLTINVIAIVVFIYSSERTLKPTLTFSIVFFILTMLSLIFTIQNHSIKLLDERIIIVGEYSNQAKDLRRSQDLTDIELYDWFMGKSNLIWQKNQYYENLITILLITTLALLNIFLGALQKYMILRQSSLNYNKIDKKTNYFFHDVSRLIEDDKIKECLEYMMDICKSRDADIEIQLTLIKSRLVSAKKDFDSGLISYDQYQIIKTNIKNSILNIVIETKNFLSLNKAL